MMYKEDVETLDKMKSLAMKDIKCVVDKGMIQPTDYANLDKAIDIVKDIETIEAMEEYGDTDYEVSANAMRSYGRDPYYNHGSYERGRSAITGRYISRDSENEHTRMKLQEMMPTVTDPNERMALQHIIDRI